MQLRQRNRSVVFVFAAPLVWGLAACGTAADKPSSEKNTLVVQASATTRAELGVAEWSMDEDNHDAPLEGRDAEGAVVIEFKRLEKEQDRQHADAYVLQQGTESARVVIVNDGTTLTVVESTFDDKFSRTMELLAQDLKSVPAAMAQGSSLATKSVEGISPRTIEPLDLTRDLCTDLISSCQIEVINYQQERVALTKDCKTDDELNKICPPWRPRGEIIPSDPVPDPNCIHSHKEACQQHQEWLKTHGDTCQQKPNYKQCRAIYDPTCKIGAGNTVGSCN